MDDLTKHKKTWAITTFFNPEGYSSKLKNYQIFRDNLKRQGVPLLAVECVFGDSNFELTEASADLLIRVRSNSVLWQKERLLNIALKHLPTECENIVWVDADIIFLNDSWFLETEKLLETYPIVQPFSNSFRLGRWGKMSNVLKNCLTPDVMREGYAYYYNKNNQRQYISYQTDGGFAWAGKKYIFDNCGFCDLAIIGGADWIANSAFIGIIESFPWALDWVKKIQKYVSGNIYFAEGKVLHLYHGSFNNRFYSNRNLILENNNYDPKRDLILNSDGCWEWSDKAPEALKNEVAAYFKARNENNKFSFSKNNFLEVIIQFSWLIKSLSPRFYYFLRKLFLRN